MISISLSAVKFCRGNEWRDVIQSEGHQVTVQFMSGPHNNERGLFLSYTKNQHTGKKSRNNLTIIRVENSYFFFVESVNRKFKRTAFI